MKQQQQQQDAEQQQDDGFAASVSGRVEDPEGLLTEEQKQLMIRLLNDWYTDIALFDEPQLDSLFADEKDAAMHEASIRTLTAIRQQALTDLRMKDVDYVLTFEELRGMFEAKNIDFSQIPDLPSHYEASAPGVGFAAGGGVAKAVEKVIEKLEPDRQVKTVYAEGLRECRQMLRIARTGKYDGYLLEGMACPGGCIAGAGTVQPPEKSRRALERYKEAVSISNPMDSQYMEDIHLLYESDTDWGRVGRH